MYIHTYINCVCSIWKVCIDQILCALAGAFIKSLKKNFSKPLRLLGNFMLMQ